MTAIVNADENWGIGKAGRLLFPIPADMKFFRATTLGHTVVMGSKTLASFPGGQPLAGRQNIVLSRREDFAPAGVTVCQNLAQLAAALQGQAAEAFVIGGEAIYRLLLPYCEKALVTRVHGRGEADTWFPNLEKEAGWRLCACAEQEAYEGLGYAFCTYENTQPKNLWQEGDGV